MPADLPDLGSLVRKDGSLLSRIVHDPQICGGRPTLRGTRMPVADLLAMLAAGASRSEVLSDFDYLTDDDISAALLYAAAATDHRVIHAA